MGILNYIQINFKRQKTNSCLQSQKASEEEYYRNSSMINQQFLDRTVNLCNQLSVQQTTNNPFYKAKYGNSMQNENEDGTFTSFMNAKIVDVKELEN